MPRQNTLALILISFTILATVITAFRIRDLPKSDLDKTSAHQRKCDTCDSELHLDQKLHASKSASVQRSYEDLKAAVREKQKQIKLKSSKFKFEFSHEDDDDDDDDDDEIRFLNSVKHSTENIPAKTISKKVFSDKKPSQGNKESITDNDDDDDDDDDDFKFVSKSVREKSLPIISKTNLKKSSSEPAIKLSRGSKRQDSYDDDDDDDNDDDDNLGSEKPITEESTSVFSKTVTKKSYIVAEKKINQHTNKIIDKDDGKDDDDDNKLLTVTSKTLPSKDNPKPSSSEPVKLKNKSEPTKKEDKFDTRVDKEEKVGKNEENKSSVSKQQFQAPKIIALVNTKVNDNNEADSADNDDDSDDDDDEADFLTSSKQKPSLKQADKSESRSKSIFNQNDDDDEDDDDEDDLSHVRKQSTKGETIQPKIESKKTESIQKHDKSIKKNDKKNSESTNSKDDVLIKIEKEIKKDEKKSKQEQKVEAPLKNKPHEFKEPTLVKEKIKEIPSSEKHKKTETKDAEPKKPKPERIDKKETKKLDKKSDDTRNHNTEPKKTENHVKSSEIHSEDIILKHECYLKQVTEVLARRNLMQSEFEDLYAFFPTFAPNFSRIHNPECRRHGQILLRQLRGTKLWALNMLDATAKIPSGVLQGNGIQLGDFDQCLSSHARVQLETGSIVRVQGKYCLARIELKAEHPELEVPVHLAQAKNLFRSRIDDPGHFVPRFSTLSWGICVPSACNPEDVEVVIKDAVKHYQHVSGVVIRVKVEEHDCQTYDPDWWEKWLELPTLLTLSLYAFVCLLVLIATFKDFLSKKSTSEESVQQDGEQEKSESVEKNKESTEEEDQAKKKQSEGFTSVFSLYRTIDKLIAPGTTDDISCIHGVRGISTVLLLIAHKFLPVAVTPYTNRVKITEVASSPLWSWCRAGWVYTDCFLLLSGALTAYRITANSESSAFKRIFNRYLRLTPALLAVVLFYAYVWDNISTGPMWGTLITKNAEVCQEGWWWNIFYVQNYFGFEDMCAPQTHQLALDMQLSIIGGIIVWALQTKPGVSKTLLIIIHGLTAYSRYTTVKDHRLTMLAYHGVSVSQLYRTARLSYTSTLHRSTPYLVGINLGLVLQNPSTHGKITLTLGWLLSIPLWGLVWYAGMDSGSTQYQYDAIFAAQYAALAPLASALAIAWLIYVVHSGHCDFLSRFLCWRPLVFVSRLSYALYLCQFIVFLTNAAVVRSSTEFSIVGLIDIQEIINILILSILLTLTFVTPMQSSNKLFLFSSKTVLEENLEPKSEEAVESKEEKDDEMKIKEEIDQVIELPPRRHFVAHREVLEEIPEAEIEYESQRDEKVEGLDEILEEEEDEEATDRDIENQLDEDEDLQLEDMEIIEEENEEGGEDFWTERDEERPRRSFRFDDDERDPEEWEWTATSNGNGAQHYRFRK